jgi:hypothetical protein
VVGHGIRERREEEGGGGREEGGRRREEEGGGGREEGGRREGGGRRTQCSRYSGTNGTCSSLKWPLVSMRSASSMTSMRSACKDRKYA